MLRVIPITSLFMLVVASPQDRSQHKLHGEAIWKRYKSGAVQFVNPARDKTQLEQIALSGRFGDVVFALPLLQTLDRLSARSTPRNPLVIMSLYRTNSKAHRSGIAVDIAGFGSSKIDSVEPGRGLQAVLGIIKALGPGEYSLGFPKPPNSDPIPLLPPPKRTPYWPYFPGPEPKLVFSNGKLVVAPKVERGRMVATGRGMLQPEILRWANGRNAPLNDLGSPELRIALAAAATRGVRFRSLFPDALDHLHLEAH